MPRNRKPKFHAGTATIIGRPNAGKSTLLNAIIGEKIAIVTAKAQTTRTALNGVWTGDNSQIVFVDTPGLHKSDTVINKRMMQAVRSAMDAIDVIVFVVDVRLGLVTRTASGQFFHALLSREALLVDVGVVDRSRHRHNAELGALLVVRLRLHVLR